VRKQQSCLYTDVEKRKNREQIGLVPK